MTDLRIANVNGDQGNKPFIESKLTDPCIKALAGGKTTANTYQQPNPIVVQPNELIKKGKQEAFKEPTNLAKRRCNKADDKHENRARDDSDSMAGYMHHYNSNRRYSCLDANQTIIIATSGKFCRLSIFYFIFKRDWFFYKKKRLFFNIDPRQTVTPNY